MADAFDRCEAIAGLLDEQRHLDTALIRVIADADLPVQLEAMLFALISAQGRCRDQAELAAAQIARTDRTI